MQNTKGGYENYQRDAIMTASPEKLTLMLYDGAIKFCNLALIGLENGNMEIAHTNIVKAQNIIVEFISTLDHKYPVAESFAIMYDYIYRRLVEANLEKNPEILKEALGFIREMRNTWEEAMNLAKNQKPVSKNDTLKSTVGAS